MGFKQKFDTLANNLPQAYAYHKLIVDPKGKPTNYIFLDINPAFEAMTGLSRDHVIGQKVTDVLPGIEKSGFDWIEKYGKVALYQGAD